MTRQETNRRLTVQEAAEVLGTSVDAVRMRVRRGTLESEKDADGRVYVWVDTDLSETKHKPNGEPTALISAKNETIALLREQLEEERRAHSEARRLLAAALERMPPQLEAPQGHEGAEEGSEPRWSNGGGLQGTAEGQQEGPEERVSWWRRFFGFD